MTDENPGPSARSYSERVLEEIHDEEALTYEERLTQHLNEVVEFEREVADAIASLSDAWETRQAVLEHHDYDRSELLRTHELLAGERLAMVVAAHPAEDRDTDAVLNDYETFEEISARFDDLYEMLAEGESDA